MLIMLTTSKDLFDHKAERLALTGYRCSMAGYDHGDPSCWDELWTAYVNDGGLDFACNSMGHLHYFVRSLRQGLGQTTQYYPRSFRRVCQQECLVVTLLSSLQHDDGVVTAYTLQRLLGDDLGHRATPIASAARQFVDVLSQAQLHLMAVPMSVIQSIVEKSPCATTCPFRLH